MTSDKYGSLKSTSVHLISRIASLQTAYWSYRTTTFGSVFYGYL